MSKYISVHIRFYFLISALLFLYAADTSFAQQDQNTQVNIPTTTTTQSQSRQQTSQQGVSVIQTPPVVFAPQGLSGLEQATLERNYRYDYRKKDIIAEPGVVTPYAEEPGISAINKEAVNEQEKLYRYFGIASVFYQVGRLEEAVEILKYIASKKPEDGYVKQFLAKAEKELEYKESEWRKTSKSDAVVLSKIKIKDLITEGIAYYKQKRYDMALLCFDDVLTLEPGNNTAKEYMEKLRRYYDEESHVEGIVDNWEAKVAGGAKNPKAQLAEKVKFFGASTDAKKLLDKAEMKTGNIALRSGEAVKKLLDKTDSGAENVKIADKLLNQEETRRVVVDVKTSTLLDQAESYLKIGEIIEQKKDEEERSNSYILGPDDQVQISVQDHPELSGKTTVGPDGMVILPLVNQPVKAQGFTVDEFNDSVKNALKKYVKDPVCYVGIVSYKSKVIYVVDEQGCTPYNITRANFTLRDALFLSDWGQNRALGRVLVMRPHKLHPIIKKVDAFDLIYRSNLSQNIKLENGDVIYVPMTAAAKTTQVAQDTLAPFHAIKTLRNEWIDDKWNTTQGWANFGRIPRNRNLEVMYNDTPNSAGGT